MHRLGAAELIRADLDIATGHEHHLNIDAGQPDHAGQPGLRIELTTDDLEARKAGGETPLTHPKPPLCCPVARCFAERGVKGGAGRFPFSGGSILFTLAHSERVAVRAGGGFRNAFAGGRRRLRRIDERVRVVAVLTITRLLRSRARVLMAAFAEGGDLGAAGDTVRLDVVPLVDHVALALSVTLDATHADVWVPRVAPLKHGDDVAASTDAGFLEAAVGVSPRKREGGQQQQR